MENPVQAENNNNVFCNNSADSKQNNMVRNDIEHSKFELLQKSVKQSHFPQLFSDSSLIMWENNLNICWLDASMALLVYNQTMRQVIKLNPDSVVSKIIKGYDNAIGILNDFTSEKPTEERLHTAREIMQKVQEISLKYLQPLIKYTEGEPDSAFCSLLNLLKEDKLIQGFFDITFAWCRTCDNCETQRVLTSTKPIITIAKVNKFEPENHVSPCMCPVCKKKDQTMKLMYKKLPACLFFHFENGAGNGDTPPFNFLVSSREYQLTGVIILEKGQESNVNHFVTYIRNPFTDKWLECNDLNMDIISFSANRPNFDLKDVYIYVYEAFDDLGTIQIEEVPAINNSNHNIPCIDISEEEDNEYIPENEENTEIAENIENTEIAENIENITAFLSASFEKNSNTQPDTETTETVHHQKVMNPSKILPKSTCVTVTESIVSKECSTFLNSNANNSGKTSVTDSTLSEIPFEKEKILKLIHELSFPNKENYISEKNIPQNNEHEKLQTEIIPANSVSKSVIIGSIICDKLDYVEPNFYDIGENGSSFINLPKSCNPASHSSKAANGKNSIASVSPKIKYLSKIDLEEKVLEQSAETISASDNCVKTKKYQKAYAAKAPNSLSKAVKKPQANSKEREIIKSTEGIMEKVIESEHKTILKEDMLFEQKSFLASDKFSVNKLKPSVKETESKDLCINNGEFSKVNETSVANVFENSKKNSYKRRISEQRKKLFNNDKSKLNEELNKNAKSSIKLNLASENLPHINETFTAKHKDTTEVPAQKMIHSLNELSKKKVIKRKSEALKLSEQINLIGKNEANLNSQINRLTSKGFESTSEIIDSKNEGTAEIPQKKVNSNKESDQSNIAIETLRHQNKKILSGAKEGSVDHSLNSQSVTKKISYKDLSANVITYLRKNKKVVFLDDQPVVKNTSVDNSYELNKEKHCNSPVTLINSKPSGKEIVAKKYSKKNIDNNLLLLKMKRASFRKANKTISRPPVHSMSVNASAYNYETCVNEPSCSYNITKYSKEKPKSRKLKMSPQEETKHLNIKGYLSDNSMENENVNHESYQKSHNGLDNILAHSLVDEASSQNNVNELDVHTISDYSEIDESDISVSKSKRGALKVRFFPQMNRLKRKKQSSIYKSDESERKNALIFKGKKKNVFNKNTFSPKNKSPRKKMKSASLLNTSLTPPSLSSPENSANEIESVSNHNEAAESAFCDVNCSCTDGVDGDRIMYGTVDYFLANVYDLFNVT